jgi:hypothetical protein
MSEIPGYPKLSKNKSTLQQPCHKILQPQKCIFKNYAALGWNPARRLPTAANRAPRPGALS